MRGWEKIFEDIVGPQRFAEVKRIAAEDDLREKLRLSAAIADPTAYPVGARVRMHSRSNTSVSYGTIVEPKEPISFTQRTVEWTELVRLGDDETWDLHETSTVPVTRLELIEE